MIAWSRLCACVIAVSAAACVDAPDLGETEQAVTVADLVATTCTTAGVLELSRQVAREVECMAPGLLVPFAEGAGIDFTGAAVLPYLTAPARADLLAAVARRGDRTLQITSAYRTLVQQYLLYRWYQLGRCGITAAAVPGNSNHESGRAIDVGNYGAWVTTLGEEGWDQTVLPADPVHFDHLASADMRGADVLAFQRLWNRNHPGDVIDEDGQYGPITGARVAMAPAGGFATGPMCAAAAFDVSVASIEGPPHLARGEASSIHIVLRNSGGVRWPIGTAMVTAEPAGRASVLASPTWPAPDRPYLFDSAVEPAATADLVIDVIAPDEDVDLTETFALIADGTRFGSIALIISVSDTEAPATSGGCAIRDPHGGASGASDVLVAFAFAFGLRRRRRPPRG